MPTNVAQAGISHHGPGQQPRLQQNLKPVANSQNEAAIPGEGFHRLHYRRKSRNGAGAEIIPVGKSAGQNDGIASGKTFRLVPDEFHRLVDYISDSVKRVVIAIGPGKDYDSEFHAAVAPCGILGSSILPQQIAA